jgi:subtilisin family serine protease
MENGFSRSLRNWTLVSVAALAFSAPAFAKYSAAEHAPGEMIVKLRSTQRGADTLFAALRGRFGQSVLEVKALASDKSLQKVRLRSDSDLKKAIETLEANPAVAYAEPNYIYHALGMPNDTDFGKLWGLNNTGQVDKEGQVGTPGADIHVMPLWEMGITGSRQVVVAVIDTGVKWDHPDLAENIYTNAKEIPGDGIDNDGNGFIDDVHGWNFFANTADSNDDNNHGSHVSGTIGGVGNNGVGVCGVNWQVSILPVKFLNNEGSGSLEAAVNSINYAHQMHVNIMSNSWGGGGESQAMSDAIRAAANDNILFVAAAGNDSKDNDDMPSYPANYDLPNVISVAATDNQDKLAYFSNYGRTTVHVAAPGLGVYSSVMDGTYDTFSGTSMATPHVSGIAALLLSYNSAWTYADIKRRLIETSDQLPGLRRKVVAKGRVNAYNALMGIIPPSIEPPEGAWKTVDFAVESPHPYVENTDQVFEVSYPGAKYIRVIFEKVDVELNYDKVVMTNAATGDVVEELTGFKTDYTTDYVQGDQVNLTLHSDVTLAGWGFKISKIQIIE